MTNHGLRIDPLREACAFLRERRASLNDIDRAHCAGYLSDRGAQAARFLWGWSAPRYHGRYGLRQERAWEKLGAIRVNRRYTRVMQLIERFGR